MSSYKRAAFRSQKVGFVFQRRNLISHLTAAQNIEVPMLLAGATRKRAHTRAQRLLGQMGLKDRHAHLPSRMSGGERQRVAIARALANNPSIVLADEPTGNLDSESGRGVLGLLRKLASDGRTIVIVTHDPKVANDADASVYIRDGRLIEQQLNSSQGGHK